MNERARKARRDRGFTLVEIMVVIVIIGLIATIIGQNVIGHSEEAKITTTRASAGEIKKAAELWWVRNSRVPTLEDLTTPDEHDRIWLEGNIVDAWNNEFMIRELEGRGHFEVLSLGPDGLEDTDDDIVVPERKDT